MGRMGNLGRPGSQPGLWCCCIREPDQQPGMHPQEPALAFGPKGSHAASRGAATQTPWACPKDIVMSALPDNEFDLEKLFLPAWATEPSKASEVTRSREQAEEGQSRPSQRRGERSRGRGRRTLDRSSAAGATPAAAAGSAAQNAPTSSAARGPKPARAPLPELQVRLIPDPKGVELVARRIRSTGRAFPLFDIAKLFLQRPERYQVEISVKKKSDGTVVQPLFVCALDDTPWLSADEVVAHVLEKHFDTFYQAERTPTEPPKGKYTFVAQCGLSGVILGPPNHHDYPNRIRQLHAERFSHMPFEAYKARIKIVRDEAVVKQWLEEQSWKTEYITLNVPEPMRLGSREAVARHFREVHAPNIVRQVDLVTLSGPASREIPCRELARLVRHTVEEQQRFPLQLATVLSQQFAAHGLQFFKVNRTITHVAVARPHYLDIENTPVSLNVKRIVQYILHHPHCTRRDLIEALAPSPRPIPVAPEPSTAAEGAPSGGAGPTAAPTPTPEQTQIIADLHWLIHQGHVIEFSNGALEVAKKPAPKPTKPAAPAAAGTPQSAPAASSGGARTTEATLEAGPASEELAGPPAAGEVTGQPPAPPQPEPASSTLAARSEPTSEGPPETLPPSGEPQEATPMAVSPAEPEPSSRSTPAAVDSKTTQPASTETPSSETANLDHPSSAGPEPPGVRTSPA